MFWIEETLSTPGPDVEIDCPACGTRGARAVTFEEQTRDWYLGFIPILSSTYNCVVCAACKTKLHASVKPIDLLGKTGSEFKGLVYVPVGAIQQALAVLALLVAIFPFVGQVMAILAVLANWKSPGWPGVVSKIALGLSFAVALLIGIMILLESIGIVVEVPFLMNQTERRLK